MKINKCWPAIIIIVIAVCTPLLATALFYFAPPQNTTNRGELLAPISLPPEILPSRTDKNAWYLLTISTTNCGVACQQRLCILRQVRLAHIGESTRIGRLWLVADHNDIPPVLTMEPGCGHQLAAAHANLQPVDILTDVIIARPASALITLLPPAATGQQADDYLYLVDPQAQVVMRYPSNTPARDIAKDLSRLLRLSKHV